MLRHISRRLFSGSSPRQPTCAMRTNIHTMPIVTCSPWVPTSVKNADRKAERCGPAPSRMRSANSLSSRYTKPMPKAAVTSIQSIVLPRHPFSMASMAKP